MKIIVCLFLLMFGLHSFAESPSAPGVDKSGTGNDGSGHIGGTQLDPGRETQCTTSCPKVVTSGMATDTTATPNCKQYGTNEPCSDARESLTGKTGTTQSTKSGSSGSGQN